MGTLLNLGNIPYINNDIPPVCRQSVEVKYPNLPKPPSNALSLTLIYGNYYIPYRSCSRSSGSRRRPFSFYGLDALARRSIISFYFLSYIFGFIDRIAKAMGLYTLSKFLDREAFFSYNSRQMIGHASVTVEYMR